MFWLFKNAMWRAILARPKSTELTSRELAVMQVFWKLPNATTDDALHYLSRSGESLAYVTVANVVRGLAAKGFLRQIGNERPFRYEAIRRFEDVSKSIVGDLISRLFEGSRKAMLVQLLDRRKLSADERAFLSEILRKHGD